MVYVDKVLKSHHCCPQSDALGAPGMDASMTSIASDRSVTSAASAASVASSRDSRASRESRYVMGSICRRTRLRPEKAGKSRGEPEKAGMAVGLGNLVDRGRERSRKAG